MEKSVVHVGASCSMHREGMCGHPSVSGWRELTMPPIRCKPWDEPPSKCPLRKAPLTIELAEGV